MNSPCVSYQQPKTTTNVLSVFNPARKEIFKVRVNRVMTIGGLKERVATKYKLKEPSDVIVRFNGVRFESAPTVVSQQDLNSRR